MLMSLTIKNTNINGLIFLSLFVVVVVVPSTGFFTTVEECKRRLRRT
jgi:hypothetical protein